MSVIPDAERREGGFVNVANVLKALVSREGCRRFAHRRAACWRRAIVRHRTRHHLGPAARRACAGERTSRPDPRTCNTPDDDEPFDEQCQ